MTNPAFGAWPDQEDQHVAMTIRRHGCYIHYVAGWRSRSGPTVTTSDLPRHPSRSFS